MDFLFSTLVLDSCSAVILTVMFVFYPGFG